MRLDDCECGEREAAGKDGCKHLWPKQLGRRLPCTESGNSKGGAAVRGRGWRDGCSLDMLNIPCLGDSNTYYQNDLGELT